MVWAGVGVSLHHKTNIVYINGNLTASRYQHEVLDTEVIPLLKNHRGMQLLHNGAPAHCTSVFENIWGELNRPERRTGAILATLNQLRANLLFEWNNLPQIYVQRYVSSIRRRCFAEVNSAVGHTRY